MIIGKGVVSEFEKKNPSKSFHFSRYVNLTELNVDLDWERAFRNCNEIRLLQNLRSLSMKDHPIESEGYYYLFSISVNVIILLTQFSPPFSSKSYFP